jgi:hypothetical protein
VEHHEGPKATTCKEREASGGGKERGAGDGGKEKREKAGVVKGILDEVQEARRRMCGGLGWWLWSSSGGTEVGRERRARTHYHREKWDLS